MVGVNIYWEATQLSNKCQSSLTKVEQTLPWAYAMTTVTFQY